MPKALVVCSGGLDSTTVAAHRVRALGAANVSLLHFHYGCHAEGPEHRAVVAIAKALGTSLRFVDLAWLKALGGSTLTAKGEDEIAGPIRGAEVPAEWVPARNLVMLSVAAAICDAEGFTEIAMGLNLEESGAYPDNTIEFFERAERTLELATQVRPKVVMPVAYLMKWEIVKLALELQAPIHLSWSCYRGGTKHCGRCGPCYMRHKAHEMLGVKDSVEYLEDPSAART